MQEAATKEDIRRLEARIEDKFTGFEARIEDKFTGFEARIDDKFTGLESKLEDRTHRLASEIVKTTQRMDRMEEGLRQEMRQLNSQVLTALDASVGRMETLWRESAVLPRILDEYGATLRDHETRLGRLES